MPLEFVVVTPAQLLAAYGIWLLMVLAALGIGWWLRGADRPETAEAGSPESVTTVEIKARRRRPPHTGAIHAAHQPAADDSPTEIIRRPDGVAR